MSQDLEARFVKALEDIASSLKVIACVCSIDEIINGGESTDE